MQNQLQKIINLSKKTGDRIVVFDQVNPENSFVLMGVDEYERIVNNDSVRDLTEQELLDRINRDIAIWKSENEFYNRSNKEIFNQDFPEDDLVDFDDINFFEEEETEDAVEDDMYYYEDLENEQDKLTFQRVENNRTSEDFLEEKKAEAREEKKIADNQDFDAEDDDDFSSIKSSIENRKRKWNIPEDVKDNAINNK